MNTELSDGVDYGPDAPSPLCVGIERLLVLFRNEGVKSCLDAFCKKYVANDYSLNVLTALRDNIRIGHCFCSPSHVDSSTEKDLVEGLSAMLSLFLERKVKQQLILTIIQWYSKILQSCCCPLPSSSLASSAAPAILPAATQCLNAFPSEPLLTDPALQLLKTLLSAPSGGRGASSRVVTAELQVALQAADVAGTLLRVMGHNPADSALAAQSFGLLAQWCAVCSRASEAMDDPAFAETLAAYLEAAHLARAAVPTLLQILNAVLTSGGRARRR